MFLKLCNSKIFQSLINISIILNTVVLAMDKYDNSALAFEILDNINLSFYVVFLFEMICKLIAFGVKLYIQDRFNIFDAIIVIISTIDVLMTYSTP